MMMPLTLRKRTNTCCNSSKSVFTTKLSNISSKKLTTDCVPEIVQLWRTFSELYSQKQRDFEENFNKLYQIISRFILKGLWTKVLKEKGLENAETYKSSLKNSLQKLSKDSNLDYSLYCEQLIPLIDADNVWNMNYIESFSSGITELKAKTLLEKENLLLVEIRIESLLKLNKDDKKETNAMQRAFWFAYAACLAYVKGKQTWDELNHCFARIKNVFYVLLCNQLYPNKKQSDSKLKGLLNIKEALQAVKRLENANEDRICPSWNKWQTSREIIMVAVVNEMLEKEVKIKLAKRAFSYWVRHGGLSETEKFCPLKELLLRISTKTIKVDYFYHLADVLLEKANQTQQEANMVKELKDKFLEIYILAMTQDYNDYESLVDIEMDIEMECDSERFKRRKRQKLSTNYMKLAEFFNPHNKDLCRQLYITAFSLNPTEELFHFLFKKRPVRERQITLSKKSCSDEVSRRNQESVLNLNPTLLIDLETVIQNPRLATLKNYRGNEDDLEKLCENIFKTGGLEKYDGIDLSHLKTDFETYEPPEVDSSADEDYEKGYEPKDNKQKRGTGKRKGKLNSSLDCSTDKGLVCNGTNEHDFLNNVQSHESNGVADASMDCDNNSHDNEIYSNYKSPIFKPVVKIERLNLNSSFLRSSSNVRMDTDNDEDESETGLNEVQDFDVTEDFNSVVSQQDDSVDICLPPSEVMEYESNESRVARICDEKLAIISIHDAMKSVGMSTVTPTLEEILLFTNTDTLVPVTRTEATSSLSGSTQVCRYSLRKREKDTEIYSIKMENKMPVSAATGSIICQNSEQSNSQVLGSRRSIRIRSRSMPYSAYQMNQRFKN